MVRLGLVVLVLGSVLACGGPQPEPPEAAPLQPVVAPTGLGPGPVSAPVAEALTGVFPQGRWIRCELPELADGAGDVGLVSLAEGEVWAQGTTVGSGAVAASVSTASGTGALVRGEEVLAIVRWDGAEPAAWSLCQASRVSTFSIDGVVLDGAGKPVGGASVRDCRGAVSQVNELGRFSVEGVVGHPCTLLVWGPQGTGLVRSAPTVVDGDGADVLVEIDLVGQRVSVPDFAAVVQAASEAVDAQRKRSVLAPLGMLESGLAGAALSPEAVAVTAGWRQALEGRKLKLDATQAAIDQGGLPGVFAAWQVER